MKVKIISPTSASDLGILTHIKVGQIINVAEEFAHELVEKKVAEYEIDIIEEEK